MVKHINVAIDDDLYRRAQKVKQDNEMTWEEFLEQSVATLERRGCENE